MIQANVENLQPIEIGMAYDQADCVEIDCSAWIRKYPALTRFEVFVTNPVGMTYIPETEMQDGKLKWKINAGDTAVPGEGCYQVIAAGKYGDRKASKPAALFIEANMCGMDCEDAPDPSKPWVNKVFEALYRIEEAVQICETAAETAIHQPIIGENGNWYLWDYTAGEYLDSGYTSRGE